MPILLETSAQEAMDSPRRVTRQRLPCRLALEDAGEDVCDLVALVVNTDPQNRRNPAYKVYIQPVSSGAAVALPTTGTEQMITPAFRP